MRGLRERSVFSTGNCVAAVFLCLLAGELLAALIPAVPTPAASPPRAAPVTQAKPPANIAAWRATLLARPLFDPSRRPPATLFQGAASVQMPRLSGIVITPTEKFAVFSPATGSPIIVTENDHFGAFTVLSITRDRVTVQGPNGVDVLRAGFESSDALDLPDDLDSQLIRIPLHGVLTWPTPPAAP